MENNNGLIPAHGGYRKLRSFQSAQLVYDLTQQSWIRALDSKFKICSKKLTNFIICYKALTVTFCDRFIDKHSRTHDQMVQAARSGVQNIAEGNMASATSKKTELKLTGVARASLEELLQTLDIVQIRR